MVESMEKGREENTADRVSGGGSINARAVARARVINNENFFSIRREVERGVRQLDALGGKR